MFFKYTYYNYHSILHLNYNAYYVCTMHASLQNSTTQTTDRTTQTTDRTTQTTDHTTQN